MSKVRIVTDSAQDFAPEVLLAKNIRVVPLTVHFGEESYKDGFEMRGKKFYDMLGSSPHHPHTSQPSPGEFQKVFEELTSEGDKVVAITLSAGLSGTYQAACLARNALPDRDIAVIDSRQGSGGYGLMALLAGEMADGGASFEDVVFAVQGMVDRMATFFCVDTLDYLVKNGRIGRAQHLMGTMLNMKPILTLDKEGYVTAADRVRGRTRVMERMLQLAQERIPGGSSVVAAIMNAQAPEEAAKLKRAVEDVYTVSRVFEGEIGSVIGSHVGAGTIAVFLLPVEG